jgi:hypothetical protein
MRSCAVAVRALRPDAALRAALRHDPGRGADRRAGRHGDPASPAALRSGVATGLQFYPVTADALARGFMRPVRLSDRPPGTDAENAMAHPVGWDNSAAAYARFTEVEPRMKPVLSR